MENTVILSIGCNVQYIAQMQRVRECLSETFPDAHFTEALMSPAYGMSEDTPPYSNMLAEFSTTLGESKLQSMLKDMEHQLGDTMQLRSQGIVMMDLDILQFNRQKRHRGDWARPYIKTLTKLLAVFLSVFCITLHAQTTTDDARQELTKAIEYYQGQKYHECILAFRNLMKHYRLNPRFTAYLGYSCYREGEYADAVKYLEESIPQLTTYSPMEQAVYIYGIAESHFNLQEYKAALPWYEKAMPLVSGIDKGDLYYHAGFSHYMLGDTHQAYQNLHKADSLFSDTTITFLHDDLHRARKAQTKTMLRALK